MQQNTELRTAWEFVENTGISIFLTGKAGTGKTTFLKTVVERSRKRSMVVAPTGVAAVNAGGVTIHSFFQLPFTPYVPEAKIKDRFEFSREKRRLIASLDLLIIDEISMVRSDLLDAVDSVLRRFRNHRLPFGGLQLLMIGDLQQLTPVVTAEEEALLNAHYETPYFFSSKALAQVDYVTIQLEKVYRQQDDDFLRLLNLIRNGQATEKELALLNSRCHPAFTPKPEDGYIRLTTHNWMADNCNVAELKKLNTPSHTFAATVDGSFPEYAYPTNDRLELKVGTQVMFVKNDISGDHLFYNGRIGRITYLDSGHIYVKCSDDEPTIDVQPMEWENVRYKLNEETREIETEVQGKFRQYPLRLAWAITIHKSQGLTFDHVVIDAARSFAPGQVYVALSRCRTLQGLVLSSPISPHSIINDTRVDGYISHQESNARQSIDRLEQLKENYFRQLLIELFTFDTILQQEEMLMRTFVEYFSRSYASLEQLHKQTCEELKKKVIDVARKWTGQIMLMSSTTLHDDAFLNRVGRSASYFADTLHDLLDRPLQLTSKTDTANKQAKTRLKNVLPELAQTYRAAIQLLTRIKENGFSVTTYLREKQTALLDAMDEEADKTKTGRKRKERKPKEKKEPKPRTHEVTMGLFREGKDIEQIAHERSLSKDTIFNHLIWYVKKGELSIDSVVSPEHQQAIRRIIRKIGADSGAAAIKALCPPDVSYGEIRVMLILLSEGE
jgi:hypothetical protein